MTESNEWYIHKQQSGNCKIINIKPVNDPLDLNPKISDHIWGPFATQNEAIAKRVGLIRSGKCLPE
jgi:hypothetical protein